MVRLGIYEKALPENLTWLERLTLVKELGFDFIELSIDETDQRLARLDWDEADIEELLLSIKVTGVPIHSICLSGHRRYPFGSEKLANRQMAAELLTKAILLAHQLHVPLIQIAGYDVYYEEKSQLSREGFIQGLKNGLAQAAPLGITLGIEIMDDPFMNSISKFLKIKEQIASPYLQVYPDLGNLSAWPENEASYELEKGINHIVAIHLKDTLGVTQEFDGQFRDVPFGEGCVDFLGLLTTLRRLDYQGSFLIEMWSGKQSDFKEAIRQAKAYLEPLLQEAGYE